MIHSILTSCPDRRRGSVYILVLGMATLVTVAGLSVLTFARLKGREILWANNSKEARVLAEAAVEWALTKLAADINWRTTYTNGVETAPVPLGNGTISFKLVDEADGDLANVPTDSVRIYGIGRAGAATRLYSVKGIPNGPGLDVLKTVAHAGGNLRVLQMITGILGPFSSNGTLTVPLGSVVNGNVEAPTLSISGTVNGTTQTVAAKTMPSSGVFGDYLAMATEIPYANIPSHTITGVVLSPAANPYGAVNPKGVYHVRVPSQMNLSIRGCRVVATLLITLEDGATIAMSVAWRMEPPQPDCPTLLVRCLGTSATLNIDGTPGELAESAPVANFNPPGTPYPWPSGTTDSDFADSYPSLFTGLLHVIAPSTITTNLGSAFKARGTVLVEGPILAGTQTSLRADPSLYANPPAGYRKPGPMVPLAGSWRWEKAP